MVEFKADGLALKIQPTAKADSEDWAQVLVESRCSGFQGEFIASLQIENLRRFAEQLSRMVDGLGRELKASLVSTELDLEIELRSDRRGHIDGSYRFVTERRDGVPTELSGAFDMDQTYIPPLLAQVRNLIESLCCEA